MMEVKKPSDKWLMAGPNLIDDEIYQGTNLFSLNFV